jgi:hypothetical protein
LRILSTLRRVGWLSARSASSLGDDDPMRRMISDARARAAERPRIGPSLPQLPFQRAESGTTGRSTISRVMRLHSFPRRGLAKVFV